MNFIRFFAVVLFSVTAVFAVFSQTAPDALNEYRQKNFERSVQICKDEITANPNNLESHVVICWSLIQLGRYDEALTYARTARSLSRYDPRVAEILGEIYYYKGDNNEALRYFQEYVSIAPSGSRIEQGYFYIGEIFIRLGKYRHADIALSTAVHWMPSNAAWWTKLGYAREYAGDYIQAVEAYEKALSLNSQLNDARRGLDRVRQTLGNR
jgi:tetratricopeptide (TPR) repeat protein